MNDLAKHLETVGEFANDHSVPAQEQYAKYHNRHAKDKSFVVGEQVIILEKDGNSKTFAQWKTGTVARVLSPYSYLVNTPNGACRHIHANKMRKFIIRNQHVGIINDRDVEFGNIEEIPVDKISTAETKMCDKLPSEKIDKITLSHLAEPQQIELLELLDEYSDCFSDTPGFCDVVEHEIITTSDFKPRQCRAYKVPEILKVEIERQVQQLVTNGFIVPSTSPMSSGVVCVVKNDKSIRLTCDYRFLNKFTVSDCQPMPNLRDSMHRVAAARCISLCDAKSGFWQLNVKKEHRWLTSFVTHHGQWEWVRLPFGLRCSANTFVRAIQVILNGIRGFSESYVDDMAILSESYQIHTKVHLRKYLDAIRESGLTLNLGKCHWAQKEIVYVGHLVGGGKHRPDPAKLLPILELKPPETKKQLRQVLGVLGFYRSYISGFADLSKCLTDLTSKNKPNVLNWSNIEQTTFDELKHRVCTAPVLSTPRCGDPFVLYTDASLFAVGCCLAQNDQLGQEHPIAYGSQKLTPTQSAWSTIEREAYAII